MKYPLKEYISDNAVAMFFCSVFIILLTVYGGHEEYNNPGQNLGIWVIDIFLGSVYTIAFTVDYFKQKKLFKKENQ
jgi:hypothetical protein